MAAMRLGGTLAKVTARSAEGFSVPDGARVAPARILGRPAAVIYRVDAGEFRRRDDTGLGVIGRLDLLDLLLSLPHDCPVPSRSLAIRERHLLRDLPPGSVDLERGTVIRRAIVPLKVDLALVPVGDWRRGLDQASLFAPFCSKAVVLARMPVDADDLLIEAAYYGIGVALIRDSDIEVLADPQPFSRECHKAAGWWFAEQVYAQVIEQERKDSPA